MRMRATRFVAAAALLMLSGGVARANGAGQCLADARNTFSECKTQCTGQFQDAKGLCRNVSPGCFAACADGRGECTDSAKQPLATCLQGCTSGLQQARTDCKASCTCGGQNPPCSGNACFIACMDTPQLAAFTCRDGCRDTFRLDAAAQAALRACAKGFRTCVNSCPPPTP